MNLNRKIFGIVAGAGAVLVLGILIVRYQSTSGFKLIAEIPKTNITTSNVVNIKKEPAPAPKIIFSEIFPNPEGSDTGKEFIKLYNAGVTDVDLKGWAIQRSPTSDGVRETLVKIGSQSNDSGLIRANGGIVRIGFSGNTSGDVVRKAAIPNSSAIFFLVDNEGIVRDQVTVGTLQEGEIFKR